MLHIKVGGVPEHFNLPWHLCIEKKLFEKEGIHVEWIDFPGGTGAMCQALRQSEIDMAIILSEGIIYDILQGNQSHLLSWYVSSPLVWGIHTSSLHASNDINDFEGKRYAISRFGSGSHLMAYVDALDRNWDINEDQWVVVNHLDGALRSLSNHDAELFLWEKFTTKPYVDAGKLKRIGECPTPWPCFAIAARDEQIKRHKDSLQKIIQIVQREAKLLKQDSHAITTIANRYKLLQTDVTKWFADVEWSQNMLIETKTLDFIQNTLLKIGKINKTQDGSLFICN